MKAILVINMPTTCLDCPVCTISDWDGEYECGVSHKSTEEYFDKIPSWCPLKPLPDKQKVKAGSGGYTRGFTAGFNSFRFKITGEKE